MTSPDPDEELIQLMASANRIEAEIADLKGVAEASIVGSPERQRLSELEEESKAAEQTVLQRRMFLEEAARDLRRPPPEELG